ncbi:MAG: valine--tRNA ligase, partial [Proteobacteria bacterium]|nr:valine--tRNA ligase [Pseudomonadota bacterium]
DERYATLVGKSCIQPLTGRHLPIVADLYADPAKGSGAVKMTPAHDFNDFEVGRRHGLELINIFDRNARLNDQVPEAYRGLDRFVARELIVADMTTLGLLEKIEDNQMTVPYGDRSGVVIEPWLTDQWFVDAAKLAGPAIEAVESGRTRFVPRNWENTYFEWMRNIQPWCISRQIWWGHQIPAWYAPDGRIFVELTAEEAQAAARAHYGQDVDLVQDQDVLDTWFSSALWPFSTLGWPDETAALKRYYPTDVLLTGFDIIFFWVARMMMMGIHFMGEVPFHTVYIHALVRDEHGQKMSKSRGNVLDPIGLFDTYGTDAVRFTLTALAVQGRDIKLSEDRIAGYRNFATKLWNAARYCLMNGCVPDPAFDPGGCQLVVNQWLVGKVSAAVRSVEEALEAYRFNDAADAVYHFVWGTFCDWYLEFTKPILTWTDVNAMAETRGATAWALAQILKVLHPFMPYITEELWAKTAPEGQRTGLLVLESWPAPEALGWVEPQAEMDWLVSVIEKIRSVRSEMGIAPKARLTLHHLNASASTAERLERHRGLIARLAGIDDVRAATAPVAGAVQVVADEATLMLPLAGVIDTGAERQRLGKELDRLQKEVAKLEAKLNNQAFVAKAPPEVIEEHRGRLAEGTQAAQKVSEALARLSSL